MLNRLDRAAHTSETIGAGILLALSGGVMDAYSYMERGHVFANAQTGNIILMSIALSEGVWMRAASYFFPVFSFAAGIFLADLTRMIFRGLETKRGRGRLHWKQIVLFAEAVILAAVAFVPHHMDFLANALTSFACGMQVESFRTIRGNSIATTMCIGNLRSASEQMSLFIEKRDRTRLHRGGLYFLIIAIFAAGAVAGNAAVSYFGQRAILICPVILSVLFFVIFVQEKKAHIAGSSPL